MTMLCMVVMGTKNLALDPTRAAGESFNMPNTLLARPKNHVLDLAKWRWIY